MSNFTTASTLMAAIVVAGSVALSIIIWRASNRLGDTRIRYIAAGFAVLAVKQAVSIYTIQVPTFHHEVTEMIGTLFDVAVVLLMAAPLFVKGR